MEVKEAESGAIVLTLSPAEWGGLRKFVKDYMSISMPYHTFNFLQQLADVKDPRE